jgi:hypothetical protein
VARSFGASSPYNALGVMPKQFFMANVTPQVT